MDISFTGLLRQIMNKEDLTVVMNSAAELLDAALVITDHDLNIYAFSNEHKPRDKYWVEAFELGECTEEFKRLTFSTDFLKNMSNKVQGGYSFPPDGVTLKYWCGFESLSPQRLPLTISALPDSDYFSEKQIDILKSFVTVLSINYADLLTPSQKVLNPQQQELYSAIRSIPLAISQARYLSDAEGYDDSDPSSQMISWDKVQLVVVQPIITDHTESIWTIMINSINTILNTSNATLFDKKIVALTNILSDTQLDQLQSFADQFDSQVGISWPFSSRLEAASHYKQSLYAIETAAGLTDSGKSVISSRPRVHMYDQFYQHHIFENNSIVSHWDEYRPVALRILDNYDKEHGSSLYHTFHTYLIQNQRATQTARVLGLHKSTVQHRIEVIQRLLEDVDLSSPRMVDSLLAAYAIDSMVNK